MPRAVFVFSCCLIASLTVACDRTEAKDVVDPAFFELVSVRRESDDQHKIAVTARDGVTWYRAEAAIVDLRHVDRAFETSGVDDGRAIGVTLNDPEKRLFNWTARHRGETLGAFFEARLTEVATVHSTIQSMLVVSWPDSDESYARALAGMRCGGDPKRIDKLTEELLVGMRAKPKSPIPPQVREVPVSYPATNDSPPATDPDFFEIISLREKADEIHVVKIKDEQGVSWFRPSKSVMNLDEFDRSLVSVIYIDDPSRFAVFLHLAPSGLERLQKMNERLVGQQVGVVIGKQLRIVKKLSSPLTPRLMIYGFAKLDSATEFGGGVLAGGDFSKISNAQAQLRAEFLSDMSDVERLRMESITAQSDFLSLASVEMTSAPVEAEIVASDDVIGCINFVELKSEKSGDYSVEVTDPAGKKWFRKRLPLLNHSDFDYDKLMISGGLEGRYSVFIGLRSPRAGAFSVWCKKHRGSRLGILVGQRCVRTFELRGRPVGPIELQSFDRHFDAAEFLRLCRMPPK